MSFSSSPIPGSGQQTWKREEDGDALNCCEQFRNHAYLRDQGDGHVCVVRWVPPGNQHPLNFSARNPLETSNHYGLPLEHFDRFFGRAHGSKFSA